MDQCSPMFFYLMFAFSFNEVSSLWESLFVYIVSSCLSLLILPSLYIHLKFGILNDCFHRTPKLKRQRSKISIYISSECNSRNKLHIILAFFLQNIITYYKQTNMAFIFKRMGDLWPHT